MLLLLIPQPASAEDSDSGERWWRTDYVGDYLSVGASLGLAIGFRLATPESASMGPSYDPSSWQSVLSERYAGELGKPYRQDTVPVWGLGVFAGAGALGIALQEWIPGANGLDEVDGQIAHDSMLGYVEAITWTVAITEVVKWGVGRLRPDFQDRVRSYHCGQLASKDPVCVGWQGTARESDVIAAGRRSFISGHASFSFAVATYWSLVVGGRMVWGTRSDDTSLPLGVLIQAGLLGLATWVAASRITDGRHHIEDVIAGAVVGFAMAHGAYWRHFGADGLPRTRRDADGPALSPTTRSLGLSLGGRF